MRCLSPAYDHAGLMSTQDFNETKRRGELPFLHTRIHDLQLNLPIPVQKNIIGFNNTCAKLTLIVLNFELAFFIPDDREERRLKEQLRKQHELLLKETVAALLSSVTTLLK